MKFNTNDYKLSLFTENVCEDCSKLKDILKNNNISFSDKSITKGTETNNNNRWDFIDAERENNGFNWFTPVLIIEDSEGNTTYIPSVQDTVNCDDGLCINDVTSENVLKVLKPYFK